MTKQYDNTIVGNIDLWVGTPEGGSHKLKFNMMVTTDDPVDLQILAMSTSDSVFTDEAGVEIRRVTRPAVAKVEKPVGDEAKAALAAHIAGLQAGKGGSVPAGNNGAEQDVPF